MYNVHPHPPSFCWKNFAPSPKLTYANFITLFPHVAFKSQVGGEVCVYPRYATDHEVQSNSSHVTGVWALVQEGAVSPNLLVNEQILADIRNIINQGKM